MTPIKRSTLALSANNTVQCAALPQGGGGKLHIHSVGPGTAFMEFADNANGVVFTPTQTLQGGFPVVANVVHEDIDIPNGATHIAFVTGSTATVYVTRLHEE